MLEALSLTAASCTGHLQYVGQRKKFRPYCSVMRVIVVLGCHVCTLWVPICSSEGHRDMATEPATPLTPSQWRAGDAAGSHYRSPPRWLIRLILLIESHPSPTVPLWERRADWEIATVPLWNGEPLNCHTLLNQPATATFILTAFPPVPSPSCVSHWSRWLPLFYCLWRPQMNDSQPTHAALGAIGIISQLTN